MLDPNASLNFGHGPSFSRHLEALPEHFEAPGLEGADGLPEVAVGQRVT